MRMTRVLLGAGLLAVLAAGYFLWQRNGEAGEDGYVTETLARGPVTSTVIATGVVNPVTTVQVGTYVSGPIIALDVDFNSAVTKGQRVAKIDPAPFLVKVQSAEANLANARAQVVKSRADLDLKRLTFERNRELRGRDLIAQNDLDTAKSNFDQAVAQLTLDQARVKQGEAALQEARINLNYTDIVSPVDGVVVSRSVDVGQTVAASFQTPTLFLIAQDLTRMQVNTSVSESDIGSVREGQAALFTVDAFPGREFRGQVVQVRNAPVTVQNVVTYDVVVTVANPDLALKPGMTAAVTITTGHREDVLRMPVRALSFIPEQGENGAARTPRSAAAPAVWRLAADGALQRIEVRTGLRDEQYVEIDGGELAPGDQVAVGVRRSPAKREQVNIPGRPRFR
jgi:HlyD family secretion protein